MPARFITNAVLFACLFFMFGSAAPRQTATHTLSFENAPDMPVKILSASLLASPGSELRMHFVVRNDAQLPIEEFYVQLPDGLFGVAYAVGRGETRDIDTQLPGGRQMAKLNGMLTNGTIEQWKWRVAEIKWDRKAGVPIRVDLATTVEPGVPLEAFLTSQEAVYFPKEPGAAYPFPEDLKVKGYAVIDFQLRNISTKPLQMAWWKVFGVAKGERQELLSQAAGALAPGHVTPMTLDLPLEILDHAVEKRFERFELVVDRATFVEPDEHSKR